MITGILLLLVGLLAGTLGAMAGVGGGILVVPLLNAGFGVDFRVAVGTSLVAVIATSSGSAANYLADDLPDLRVAMILEVATVAGALTGGLIAHRLPVDGLRVLFGFIALYLAGWQVLAARMRRDSAAALPRNFHAGFGISIVAGFVSSVLGIGGGALKVPVMNMVMGLPFRVAAATSNYMIGITAAASALLYFRRGEIDLAVATPTVLGVLAGAAFGSWAMPRTPVAALRSVFALVLVAVGVQMLWRGLGLPSLWEGP